MSQVNNQELFKENKNDSQQKNPIVFTAEKKEIDQQIGLKSNVSLPSVNGNAGADVGDMKTEEKKSGSADSQQKAQKENELVNVAPRVIREIKNVANKKGMPIRYRISIPTETKMKLNFISFCKVEAQDEPPPLHKYILGVS